MAHICAITCYPVNQHRQKKKYKVYSIFCYGMFLLLFYGIFLLLLLLWISSIKKLAKENGPTKFQSEEPLSVVNHPHGQFSFWPDSHQVQISKETIMKPSLIDAQRDILDDDDIDMDRERRRCASYKFDFPIPAPTERRRLFLGGLIADDSMEVMRAVGLEAYNIFHTVSYIESNSTQNLSPRKWRYANLSDRHKLYQLFGLQTKVRV